jgi:hypothetical protein
MHMLLPLEVMKMKRKIAHPLAEWYDDEDDDAE